MNIEKQSIDAVNAVLKLQITKADYQEKVEKTLKDYRKKANVPGFRPGMVPVGLLKKMYGKSVLVDEVNKLVSESLYKYIKDNNLDVLGEPLPSADQPENNFDGENDFSFSFDIALAPEYKLNLTAKDKLKYYAIVPDEKMIENQTKAYTGRFGTYSSEESVEANDMVKGNVVEIDENKKPKDGGVNIEGAVVTPAYMKDEKIKADFAGAKKGDVVVFNPNKAFGGNEAELASFLRVKKEDAVNMTSDVMFTINEITRYKEAEVNQELFDKVFGEGNVKSEAEFKAKIVDSLKESLEVDSQYKLSSDVRELIAQKMEKLEFPVAFLKRWVLETNEKLTAEDVEKDFDKMLDDLKWQLAKDKLAKEGDVKVEPADIDAFAKKVAKSQFAQYGMMNVPDDVVENYAKDLTKNKEAVRNIFDRVMEDKVIEVVKGKISVETKEVSMDEFNKLVEKK